MNKFIKIGWAVATCVWLLAFACNESPSESFEAPLRPQGVGKSAVFVGGADGGVWIHKKGEAVAEKISVKIFNDFTGELEFHGELRICDYCVGELNDSTSMTAYTGERIYLSTVVAGKFCYYEVPSGSE